MAIIRTHLFIFALIFCVHCGSRTDSVPNDETGTLQKTNDGDNGREMVECPVCGLRFKKSEAKATFRHKGCDYYFMLEDHKQAFAASCKENAMEASPATPNAAPLCRPSSCD